MDLKKQTIEAYDKGAKEWATKFNLIGPRAEDVERGLSYVKKVNPKVLEIGCGNGREALEILKFTNDYTGIDASKEMIKLANETAPNRNFIVADMETYEFPQGIDVIFAFASLLHSDKDSIRAILERAYKALNSDGIFYISVKYDRYQKKIKKDEYGERVFYFYTEQDFNELANGLYEVIFTDRQTLRGVDWLTIVLKKNN